MLVGVRSGGAAPEYQVETNTQNHIPHNLRSRWGMALLGRIIVAIEVLGSSPAILGGQCKSPDPQSPHRRKVARAHKNLGRSRSLSIDVAGLGLPDCPTLRWEGILSNAMHP